MIKNKDIKELRLHLKYMNPKKLKEEIEAKDKYIKNCIEQEITKREKAKGKLTEKAKERIIEDIEQDLYSKI